MARLCCITVAASFLDREWEAIRRFPQASDFFSAARGGDGDVFAFVFFCKKKQTKRKPARSPQKSRPKQSARLPSRARHSFAVALNRPCQFSFSASFIPSRC